MKERVKVERCNHLCTLQPALVVAVSMSVCWRCGQQAGSVRWWEKSTKDQGFMHFISSCWGETPMYPAWSRELHTHVMLMDHFESVHGSSLYATAASHVNSCYFSGGEFSQLSHLCKGFGMIKSIILPCRICLLSASSLILYNTSL